MSSTVVCQSDHSQQTVSYCMHTELLLKSKQYVDDLLLAVINSWPSVRFQGLFHWCHFLTSPTLPRPIAMSGHGHLCCSLVPCSTLQCAMYSIAPSTRGKTNQPSGKTDTVARNYGMAYWGSLKLIYHGQVSTGKGTARSNNKLIKSPRGVSDCPEGIICKVGGCSYTCRELKKK